MTSRHQDRSEAVSNDLMKEQDQRMPINVDKQSRVTFGGTKKLIFLTETTNSVLEALTTVEIGRKQLWRIATHKVSVLVPAGTLARTSVQNQTKYLLSMPDLNEK